MKGYLMVQRITAHVGKQALCCFMLLLSLLNASDSAVSLDHQNTNLEQTVLTIEDTIPHDVMSPNFPKCCQAAKYILRKGEKTSSIMCWKLLFTDLDMPPNSQLLIYGIKRLGVKQVEEPIGAAMYKNGAWIRPVVLYHGDAISIEFHPAQNSLGTSNYNSSIYVGFKGAYWLDTDLWVLDKPFTICPSLGDALQRSRVVVKELDLPFDQQHYRMYCVWQLKPVPNSDLQIYVKLEKLSGRDAKVKIHKGLTSESPEVFSSSQISASRTFTSNEGFYITLSKEAVKGEFVMSNGVFKPLVYGEECVLLIDGQTVQGFKCIEDTQDLCILEENKCDKNKDCPSGSDELPQICDKSFVTTTATITTLVASGNDCPRGRCNDGRCPEANSERCPDESCPNRLTRCPGTLLCVDKFYESCPGEKCTDFEKNCADGSCVSYIGHCSDGSEACGIYDKRCKDGRCLRMYSRCPEDPCPKYKPHKCGGDGCIYQSSVCDGVSDCGDGSDERNCPWPTPTTTETTISSDQFHWLPAVALGPLVCICYCLLRKCCKCKRKGESSVDNRNREERMEMNPSTQPMSESAPTVIPNDYSRPRVVYYTNSHSPSAPPPLDHVGQDTPPSAPPTAPPTAPPAYGDVVNNQEMCPPPLEPPPAYSEVAHIPAAGPVFLEN